MICYVMLCRAIQYHILYAGEAPRRPAAGRWGPHAAGAMQGAGSREAPEYVMICRDVIVRCVYLYYSVRYDIV